MQNERQELARITSQAPKQNTDFNSLKQLWL
uniref:Uncharacterized protein n=1 Tax=Anguilla anguilla TaxID=7936 RepID=A0A0E9TU99_ANGAN